MVRLGDDEGDKSAPVTLASHRPVVVRDGSFVDGTRLRLFGVPFDEPGVYEFQLVLEGFDEPIARERVLLKEM